MVARTVRVKAGALTSCGEDQERRHTETPCSKRPDVVVVVVEFMNISLF